jgi:hypothetical protein
MISVIVTLTLLLSNLGYTEQEIKCTMNLVQRESNFNVDSRNKQSGAYGLFQILNIKGTLTVPRQVERFDKYIKKRYNGNPCKAWDHFKLKKWY